MKLGLCQMPVTASKTENFATMRRYVRDAAAAGCDLVVLPEMWCCPYSNAAFAQYAEPQGGETWRLLCGSAREYGVWLVAGSVDTPFGTLGVAISFDVRFAELFRILALEGAQLIVVPAAFNMTTGPAHWELLFRARALDNQCFAAGCAPARDETAGYVSYAHSLVCDPWGRVQAQAEAAPQLLICDIDLTETDAVRAQIPVLSARRTDLYQLKYEKDS